MMGTFINPDTTHHYELNHPHRVSSQSTREDRYNANMIFN